MDLVKFTVIKGSRIPKICFYGVFCITTLFIFSCSPDREGEGIGKCSYDFGIDKENLNFNLDDKIYIKSANHMIKIRKYSGEKNIDLSSNCGYKEKGSVSCFRFIDFKKGIGFRICVSPSDGTLLNYDFEN